MSQEKTVEELKAEEEAAWSVLLDTSVRARIEREKRGVLFTVEPAETVEHKAWIQTFFAYIDAEEHEEKARLAAEKS